MCKLKSSKQNVRQRERESKSKKNILKSIESNEHAKQ